MIVGKFHFFQHLRRIEDPGAAIHVLLADIFSNSASMHVGITSIGIYYTRTHARLILTRKRIRDVRDFSPCRVRERERELSLIHI